MSICIAHNVRYL